MTIFGKRYCASYFFFFGVSFFVAGFIASGMASPLGSFFSSYKEIHLHLSELKISDPINET